MSKTDNDHEAILIQTKSIVIYKFKNCSFLTPGEYDEVSVPRDCINGTIRWNYPTEYAIVHFSPNTGKNFLVCIGKSVYKFELFDITGGIRQPISYGKILLKNTEKVYFSGSWQRFWKWKGEGAFKKSWKAKTKKKSQKKTPHKNKTNWQLLSVKILSHGDEGIEWGLIRGVWSFTFFIPPPPGCCCLILCVCVYAYVRNLKSLIKMNILLFCKLTRKLNNILDNWPYFHNEMLWH